MNTQTYKGIYTDKNGTREIEIKNDFQYLYLTIDGFPFIGTDFDSFELSDILQNETLASSKFDLKKGKYHQSVDDYLELTNYQIHIQIPQILIEIKTKKEILVVLDFLFEITEQSEKATISLEIDKVKYEAKKDFLELIFNNIQHQFKGKYRFKNCYGCLYADYSVYGQGFMGSILCFKNQKEAYCKVNDKDEYMELELHDSQQQEIYCCDEYEIREKSIGYRGTVI